MWILDILLTWNPPGPPGTEASDAEFACFLRGHDYSRYPSLCRGVRGGAPFNVNHEGLGFRV